MCIITLCDIFSDTMKGCVVPVCAKGCKVTFARCNMRIFKPLNGLECSSLQSNNSHYTRKVVIFFPT